MVESAGSRLCLCFRFGSSVKVTQILLGLEKVPHCFVTSDATSQLRLTVNQHLSRYCFSCWVVLLAALRFEKRAAYKPLSAASRKQKANCTLDALQ